jgi:hypothetical protein
MTIRLAISTPRECGQSTDENNPVAFRQLLIELDELLEKLNNRQAKRSGFEGDNTAT